MVRILSGRARLMTDDEYAEFPPPVVPVLRLRPHSIGDPGLMSPTAWGDYDRMLRAAAGQSFEYYPRLCIQYWHGLVYVKISFNPINAPTMRPATWHCTLLRGHWVNGIHDRAAFLRFRRALMISYIFMPKPPRLQLGPAPWANSGNLGYSNESWDWLNLVQRSASHLAIWLMPGCWVECRDLHLSWT